MNALNDEQRKRLLVNTGKPRKVTFLPEPERRPRRFTIISVDDHVVEPPDLFEGRLPSRFVERGPRVIEDADGRQQWHYEGTRPSVGLNAVVGRPLSEASFDPARFDEMRKGSWDPRARVADMDINGVYASLNFPSALGGFAGQRLQLATRDPEMAMAVVRAWNDWHLEEWAGPRPDRIIPCQLPWLLDPRIAADMIRENAARGFHAVTFTEAPEKLGLPSLHTGYWDPFLRACADTGTVVCLHVGSGSSAPTTAPDAPGDTIGVLFFAYAMFACVDWLYSRVAVRFPDLKICLSEGGIAWVAGLLDRLDHVRRYDEIYGTWPKNEPTPAEVLQRNFWFCALDDPSSFKLRHRIGVENLLLESDYPHLDSTWPDTQRVVARSIGDLPEDEIRKITWENASRLFRHPVPDAIAVDPESY